jgi:hypothetical protein
MRRIRTRWIYLTLLNIALAVLVACSSATGNPANGVETVRPDPSVTGTAGEPLPTQPSGLKGTPPPGFTNTPATTPTPSPAFLPGHDGVTPVPDMSTAEATPTYSPPHTGDGALPTIEAVATYDPPRKGGDDPYSFVSDRQCGDGPNFSAFPMDLSNVPLLTPLGNVNPPGRTFPTSHMYFAVPVIRGETSEGPFGDGQVFPPTPVYSVADGILISIGVSTVTTSLSGQEVS